jgi:hypothetical protein
LSERMTTAPRSGGRTAERVEKGRRTPAGTKGTARGARQFPVQGATALKLDAQQQRETATAPRLRVAPPAPINAPRAPFIALVVAVVVAGVLGILLINTKTAENAFELDTLQDRQGDLDARQQALENEIAANNMPGSLDAAARRLGLVKADSPAYIRLQDGKILGIPKPGRGEPAVTAQDPKDAAAAVERAKATQDATTQDVTPTAPGLPQGGAPAAGQTVTGGTATGGTATGQTVTGQGTSPVTGQ